MAEDFWQECLEYLRAIRERDLVEVLDSLVDLQYFLFGMVVIHGLQDHFEQAFDIVHSSNMSKLDNDGNPILRPDGKVIKGENFFYPTEDLRKLLR